MFEVFIVPPSNVKQRPSTSQLIVELAKLLKYKLMFSFTNIHKPAVYRCWTKAS